MSQREVAIVGKNNTRALVTGQEELLVKVNTIGPVDLSAATLTALENVTVQNPAGAAAVNIQDGGNTITVDILDTQFEKPITPRILLSSTSSNPTGSINSLTYAVSFASNGTGPALVSTDEGTTYQSIPSGTTLNFDAGGLGWYYEGNKFYWDTTAAGASLIITYNS